MSQNIPPSKNAGLARFACAHCRQKKIKCSREFPKCAACRPWPGECVYHRLGPISRSEEPNSVNVAAKRATSIPLQYHSNVDQRLSRVEKALETLSGAVSTTLSPAGRHGDFEPPSSTERSHLEVGLAHRPPVGVSDTAWLTVDDSHSFAYLGEVSKHLESIKNKSFKGQLPEHQEAATALQDLSKSLTTVTFQTSYNDKTSFEIFNGYFVPSRSVGYKLISCFLQNVQLADVLFTIPSDEILLNVIFDPVAVHQRAWVVYVNFILLSLLQNDSSQADVVDNLRKNTNLALNDFRIFLEPSELNIQVLLLLGCHGEQYASPNLSWMLVGHACRQAQAVGLHGLGNGHHLHQQRRLALFWSLFSMDKSCSLAFGRPMLLPTSIYENVPLPDFEHLLRYHPHRDQPISTESGPCVSKFGAHFFIQRIQLAKLTGAVLNLLAGSGCLTDFQALIIELQSWDAFTNELLSKALDAESASSTPRQLQEMTIGVRTMRFQYLHILILLLRKDANGRERCIQAARDAIELLPDIVSNSNHVYNGLVWQLLYYPFTPFFTVFGHILDHPSVPTTNEDLELLTKTVTYFSSMKLLGVLSAVSSKLEKTALVFCNLARFITTNERVGATIHDLQSTVTASSSEESALTATGSDDTPCGVDASSSEVDFESYTDAFMAYIRDQDYHMQLGFDNSDIENILGCLDPDVPSPRKRKRSFGSTLDWFSWDTHYYKD